MAKLTKTQKHVYVENDGEYRATYFGTPKVFWFIADQLNVRASTEARHNLDYKNDPWDQFAPNGEAFRPLGQRAPLAFHVNTAMRRSISATLQPDKYVSFAKISEAGLTPHEGSIRLHIKGTDDETTEQPHGSVWLAPAAEGLGEEEIYVSLVLEETNLDAICRELADRPASILRACVKFAAYQEDMDRKYGGGGGIFGVEEDADIPIIEATLEVVDDWRNPAVATKADLPAVVGPEQPRNDQPNFTELVKRMNFAVALLAILILVAILK
ncbi:hypothetical protein N5J77_28750 [Sphingobium yanoikuyae]|uniref:Uncharacterized protein n=1 Tax=Sphingobium yanoikuyae TaxID=13690 RepID=A0AA43BB50_SPHYA|nr:MULTISPECIES: hypothetical protein [Sphingobium]MDH2135121.1 hypothetical protein [Sphingobium yanoikuyae]MDH2153120.1 hypothetical protein [Sphingobium yanoikuyae]MDH2170480.1 hypothetical protein [Sphingobium yanoikuyae]